MSDLHKDCTPEMTQVRAKYGDERFQQLNELLNSANASVWTYLMTVNGGAAAGVLAFIGGKPELAKLDWPYWVLLIFIVGLVLVGLAHAFMAHKAQDLVKNWVDLTGQYWRNELPWSQVHILDDKLVDRWRSIPWVLGWGSLIAFFFGVTWAAYGFRQVAFAP